MIIKHDPKICHQILRRKVRNERKVIKLSSKPIPYIKFLLIKNIYMNEQNDRMSLFSELFFEYSVNFSYRYRETGLLCQSG